MTIKGIFFDAGDVLYRRAVSSAELLSVFLAERGLATEVDAAARKRLNALRAQANTGRIGPEEYWSEVFLLHGIASTEERSRLVDRMMAQADAVLPMDGVRETLARLKQRGFLLGIVTDTVHPLKTKQRWLDAVGVSEFIDAMACSSALGAHKPDPATYLHALQQAGLAPHEAAFVGHDADELEGAHRVGMATVAVNHGPGAQADYYARSLVDLLNVPIFSTKQRDRTRVVMKHDIEVIFIDVGNTLRVLVEDELYQAQARRQIAELVGTPDSPEAFCELLDARYKVYRKWAFETLLEATEKELWTRWLLPDWPAERIAPLSGELTFLYRQTMGRRFARPDVRSTVVELTRRGYRLGILSNTITEREIPRWLEEDGLSQYFPTVILSSILGHRKPGPEIYHEAARQAGVDPSRCVYVGDNPVRDVEGCRESGFAMIIILLDPTDPDPKKPDPNNEPDLIIGSLAELLDVFPDRHTPDAGAG
jgi:putative hydrolase of the HAD superfamily